MSFYSATLRNRCLIRSRIIAGAPKCPYSIIYSPMDGRNAKSKGNPWTRDRIEGFEKNAFSRYIRFSDQRPAMARMMALFGAVCWKPSATRAPLRCICARFNLIGISQEQMQTHRRFSRAFGVASCSCVRRVQFPRAVQPHSMASENFPLLPLPHAVGNWRTGSPSSSFAAVVTFGPFVLFSSFSYLFS
jgi:hypothetical protein